MRFIIAGGNKILKTYLFLQHHSSNSFSCRTRSSENNTTLKIRNLSDAPKLSFKNCPRTYFIRKRRSVDVFIGWKHSPFVTFVTLYPFVIRLYIRKLLGRKFSL